MAEDHVPDVQIEDRTLEEMRGFVVQQKRDSIAKDITTAEAYNQVMTRIMDPTLPPEQLSMAIKFGFECVQELTKHLEDDVPKTGFGLLAGEMLAQRLQDVACVDNTWQPSVRSMLECFDGWQVDQDQSRDDLERQSSTLKQWIFKMMQDPEYCSDVSLRLHMVSLVCLWSDNEIRDAVNMGEVRHGLISLCSLNKLDSFLPSFGLPSKVLSHFVQVLFNLQRWGHLNVVSAAAIEQAQIDHVGPETLCLMRIVELAADVAVEARHMDRSTRSGVHEVLFLMSNVMALLSVLLMSRPLLSAFEGSCLAESAAASLVKTTGAVLATMPTTHPNEDLEDFVHILTVMDIMMFSVNTRDELRSLKHVMHISHFYTLADLYEYSKKIGYPFRRKLAKFNERCNENCPDR